MDTVNSPQAETNPSLNKTATPRGELKNVTVTSIDSKQTVTQMRVDHLSPGERFMRALKPAAVLWAVAGGFLFVPIIHFIVPPTLLIVSIFVGFKVFVQTHLVHQGQCTCPLCSKTIVVRNLVYQPETKVVCEHCRNHLKLRFG